MQRAAKIATGCAFILTVFFLVSIGRNEPAHAQGGIVCAYGPKKYRDCCHQSYKEHRKLSARARERDIDACMHPKKPAAKVTAPKETPAKEPPAKEPSAKESPTKDSPTKESPAEETPAKDKN